MAPKASMSKTSPSVLIADAISSLQKAVGNALACAEEQGKADLTCVNAGLAALRHERDEAIKLLNDSKLECKEWERRGEGWKSSIKHQVETIAQLREETSQWKNQLLRFEESSRQEIQDWKEQYLRAEQERSRLSARLDQLTAEQLQRNRPLNGQHDSDGPSYTYGSSAAPPKPQKTVTKRPRASTSTTLAPEQKSKPTSGYTTDRERTYVDNMLRQGTPKGANRLSVRTPKHKAEQLSHAAANVTPRASTTRLEPSPPSMPQSRLIRRVHAVVEVPVKEEEYSGDGALDTQPYEESSGSGSEYVPEKPKHTSGGKTRRRPSTSANGKQKAQQGRYIEIDEPSERDESEDDQLLIGSDDDADRTYSLVNAAKTLSKHTSVGGAQLPNSAKRRKLNQGVVIVASTQNKGSRRE
ncbi:uncharacterized protein PHACADRAFT_177160 [Phanerochaete carnosa HHB-10118-sp]|uniref:Uncharacterized protein n=1 Tax=Phanerochaete carnosa (strain HHB-10118-sp) TaxID=650164 RepID=K5VY54_PHACS|nr:uncharacterized protein PHACADRAFT_177160 [Phanerochaete carnosa HHB-10118-sp]EKM51745.1 hypothetical protein PHACADRAFT_177160 [Phanerochaete carnosa HHB-10118-sp]